ncbi:MAG: hypothetical protein QXY99_05750 [Thermoproteota archaeon]
MKKSYKVFVKIPLEKSVLFNRTAIWGVRNCIITDQGVLVVVDDPRGEVFLGHLSGFIRKSRVRTAIFLAFVILVLFFSASLLGDLIRQGDWGYLLMMLIPCFTTFVLGWFLLTELINGRFVHKDTGAEFVPMSHDLTKLIQEGS